MKKYKIFISELEFAATLAKFREQPDQIFDFSLQDEETKEGFKAKVMVSTQPGDGYDGLTIESSRGFMAEGWYVKIVEREDAQEEEEITIFQQTRLGARRGYMLSSIMAEEKTRLKKEIMTSELEKRLKRKQELVKEILHKEGEPENSEKSD